MKDSKIKVGKKKEERKGLGESIRRVLKVTN